MKKSFKGFTLVEVLIVIIIVGILIAALLPRLVGTQGRARDMARQAVTNQIAQAAALAVADGKTVVTSATTATCSQTVVTDNLADCPTGPQGNAVEIVEVSGNLVVVSPTLEVVEGNCDSTGATGTSNFCVPIEG